MAVVEVEASLSIYGDESLTAAHVSEVLGVQPTRTHECGDLHTGKRMAERGMRYKSSYWGFHWPLTVRTPDDFHGMASLNLLAQKFATLAPQLAALRSEGHTMRVWMLGHSDSEQIGFVIDVDTMRALSEMGTPLFPDLFVNEPDGDPA